MSNLNPKIKLNKKRLPQIEELYKQILEGDRFALGKAITLIESNNPQHRKESKELISMCLKNKRNTLRIGITGSPGVGKSTLLENLGLYIIEKGYKPAILAIDPSSKISGGSILGDKTRMNKLSKSENAFIRPSPAGKSLGGVANKTKESVILVETAGYNPVFIETVGVGQSETAVHSMTDLFILLLQPGAGDEIQGIKRGIMEMADIIVVNKADGENIHNAEKTFAQYSNALGLLAKKESGWSTKIMMISAMENKGIDKLWDLILEFEKTVRSSGYFDTNRKKQNQEWFHDYLFNNLLEIFTNNPELKKIYKEVLEKVENGNMSLYEAGDYLIDILVK